jgi:hypothetical protein
MHFRANDLQGDRPHMYSAFPVRRGLTLAALAAATVLASCAQPPPPAPPPPPPAVSLSSKLIEQASAYRAYVTHAAAISPAFSSGPQVAESLKTGESYQPDQLLRGAIVYGAVAALQDPAFVAGVRKYVTDAAQRQQVAYAILKEPAYAASMEGAASAAGLVESALSEDGRKLLDDGRQVKQAAYDVQKSSWSKSEVPGRDARLSLAKQLSSTPGLGETDETTRLQQASVGQTQLGLAPANAAPPYSPVVLRSLAVAALAALGYADDAHLEQVTPLLADPTTGNCLNLSKLNLYQCLAVAKPYYEDVFCLGQHAMEETGGCLLKGAGVAIPPDPIIEAARARAEAAKLEKAATKGHAKAHAKRSHKR